MQHLVLLGACASNLLLVQALVRHGVPSLQVSCIAEPITSINPRMLAGLVSGQYPRAACEMPAQALLESWGVAWIPAQVEAIHAKKRIIQLQDGRTINFDWLAMNSTPEQYASQIEAQIPGANAFGLLLYPMERFVGQWEHACHAAADKPLRVSVVGHSLYSMEIALATQYRLPAATVTWVASNGIGAMEQTRAYMGLLHTMKKQRIHVIHDQVLSCHATALQLGCGAQLATDIALIALEPNAPAWQTKHPHSVFYQPPNAWDMAPNYQMITGQALQSRRWLPQLQTFYAGTDRAIAQWKQHCWQGRMAGWLKHYQQRLGGLHTH